MQISLVSTIFNDRRGLERFFIAMSGQSRMPDEIIIVDAGSHDGTWEMLQSQAARADRPWDLTVLQEAGCNVARGRDLAIEDAHGGLIVSTDIGCDWDAEWLEELIQPLTDDPTIELVNGSWTLRKNTLVGAWALTEWAIKGEQRFEAHAKSRSSSRSIAYRKACWQALGGYPQDLTLAADDAVFARLAEKADVSRGGAPIPRCYWHRHSTLTGFLKETYRYGLGDGEATIRRGYFVLAGGRLLFEFLALIFGLVGLLPVIPFSPWPGIILLLLAAASIARKIATLRGAAARLRAEGVAHAMYRLLIFTYGTKIHWLRGYLKGLWRGRIHCRDCRQRLKEMTPELYRDRLADYGA